MALQPLPVDWRFLPDHTGLDESGALGDGNATLVDWACTAALTEPGGLPEDGSFGAALNERIRDGVQDEQAIAAVLRGHLLEDDRVEEVDLTARTEAGTLKLPVGVVASSGPYRLSGPLDTAMAEAIIADMGLE